MLPFTTEQFLGVFEKYNEAIWPMQFVLVGIGLAAVALAVWKQRLSDFFIGAILGAFWLRMGGVYHILFFSRINSAAISFGAAFVVQGLLFLHAGPVRSRLSFGVCKNWTSVLGACGLLCGLGIYPVLGLAFGHSYPRQPTFGVPCPTTIFTFGLLLWTDKPVPKYLLIISVLWAVIGASAAFLLGVWEDFGLFAGAVVAATGLVLRDRRWKGEERRSRHKPD